MTASRHAALSKRLAGILVALGVGLVALELGLALGVRLELFPIKTPTYSWVRAKSSYFWSDLNPDFGVWRKPNVRFRQTRQCFDLKYLSNSVGARDVERPRDVTGDRVVVLGDSMMEGLGVRSAERISDILEARTGRPQLNFATSGVFGPTQYFLVYKTLAKKFSHSAVLVGLFLANDFEDDDPEIGRQVYPNRYRPYFVREGTTYRLEYFQDALEKSTYRESDEWTSILKRFLSEFTYTYNAAAYFKQFWLTTESAYSQRYSDSREGLFPKEDPAARKANRPLSRYFEYTEDQLARLRYVLKLLKAEAGSRPVIVVLLPSRQDFARLQEESASPQLVAALESFGSANGIEVVDLLYPMARLSDSTDPLFLTCDPHWSAKGHQRAAELILERVSIYRANSLAISAGPTRRD